ncbi:MAG: hypothetical protein MJ175_12465 [Clostridia bacterium]|nr:hypothetical protein [Clostridia bacterium]
MMDCDLNYNSLFYARYLKNGEVWLMGYNTFDDEGHNTVCVDVEKETISFRNVPFTEGDIIEMDDGNILIPHTKFEGYAMLYHPDTDMAEPYIRYTETEEARKAISILYYEDNAYIINQSGIYMQSPGKDETKILDWDHSDLSCLQFEFIRMLDESRILVLYNDTFLKETYPAILVPIPERHILARNEITMASIGMSINTRQLVKESVCAFNRNSDTYHISLTDYDAMAYDHVRSDTPHAPNGRSIPDPSFEAFEADALNDQRFDIYLFGEYETTAVYSKLSGLMIQKNYRTMMDKLHLFGALPDMDDYHILPSISHVFEKKGTMTAVPLSFHFTTMLTLPEIVPDGKQLTLDTVYQLAEDCDLEHVLFSNWVSQNLNTVMQFRMIDRDSGTARFDSDEYVRYLEFYPEIEKKYIANKGVQHYTAGDVSMKYSGKAPGEAMADREYDFLLLDIVGGQDFWFLNYIFQNTPVNFCGFPAEEGTTHLFYSDMTLCPGMDANQDGVRAFLDYMLSDEVQCSDGLMSASLPVTENALSSLFSEGYGYYLPIQMIDSFTLNCIAASKNHDEQLSNAYEEVPIPGTFANQLYHVIADGIFCPPEDETITDIINEEYAAIVSGIRDCKAAADMIQNRVQLYLNE